MCQKPPLDQVATLLLQRNVRHPWTDNHLCIWLQRFYGFVRACIFGNVVILTCVLCSFTLQSCLFLYLFESLFWYKLVYFCIARLLT